VNYSEKDRLNLLFFVLFLCGTQDLPIRHWLREGRSDLGYMARFLSMETVCIRETQVCDGL